MTYDIKTRFALPTHPNDCAHNIIIATLANTLSSWNYYSSPPYWLLSPLLPLQLHMMWMWTWVTLWSQWQSQSQQSIYVMSCCSLCHTNTNAYFVHCISISYLSYLLLSPIRVPSRHPPVHSLNRLMLSRKAKRRSCTLSSSSAMMHLIRRRRYVC